METNVEAKSVVVQAEDSVTPEFMLEKLQKVRCGICGVFIIIIIINVRCLVCGHASEEAAPRNIIFWRHDFLFFFCPESTIHRSDSKFGNAIILFSFSVEFFQWEKRRIGVSQWPKNMWGREEKSTIHTSSNYLVSALRSSGRLILLRCFESRQPSYSYFSTFSVLVVRCQLAAAAVEKVECGMI